jgi:hypothetical protein
MHPEWILIISALKPELVQEPGLLGNDSKRVGAAQKEASTTRELAIVVIG